MDKMKLFNDIKRNLAKLLYYETGIHAEPLTIPENYENNTFGKFVEMTFDDGSRIVVMKDYVVIPLKNVKNLKNIQQDGIWFPYSELSAALMVAKKELGIDISNIVTAKYKKS